MTPDDFVAVQDAFERADRGLQSRYVKNHLIPPAYIETFNTSHAIQAGETLREVLLIPT